MFVPSYPAITTLLAWQTSLLAAVVTASGEREYYLVAKWIGKSFDKALKFEDLADSEHGRFVTLDMKLCTRMTLMIINAGHSAKELKDLINAKMEEAMKIHEIIKGRQVVHMLLAHFKTFDNSEMLYGFDHLSNLVCGVDL